MTISNKPQRKDPLSLGFIGGGLSSAIGQTHFAATQLDGRWRLAAGVFSRHSEINSKTAEAWNVSNDRLYESWQTFLDAETDRLDAVVVLTPTPDHSDIVCVLLEKGVPVICEKPLASSLEEVNLIQKLFRKSHNFLSVTYNYSGYPMVRELRERVRNGEIGKLQKIHFEMPQEGFVYSDAITGELAPPQSWRLKDGLIPAICLDLGVHLHHLAYFLTGKEPARTIGEFSNHSTYLGLVDDVMMWLEYEDGMKGSFWMSKTALGYRNGLKLRLYGDEGSAEWVQMKPEELRISYKDETRMIVDRASKTLVGGELRYNRMKAGHPSGFIEAFANLYCDIADALIAYRETGKQNNPYVFGLEHSVRGLELFAATKKSNDHGCWIELND
jgi:predicted dehydrogenase|tara:strand:+ start:2644 stop:3801 length:1158 start_codon:yes stop_codon:yes gene_type:complete